MEVRPADVGDEPVRGAMPRVHVGVDEAGDHELATRVDLAVHRPVEAGADEDDGVVLEDEHAVAVERMGAVREADDPAAADQRAH